MAVPDSHWGGCRRRALSVSLLDSMPLTEEQRRDYVQDAEAFFAIMRRAGQWDGLLPDAVNLWLENFDTPSLRYFACRILRGLLYYSERDTETLLREGLNHQVLGRLVRMEH